MGKEYLFKSYFRDITSNWYLSGYDGDGKDR